LNVLGKVSDYYLFVGEMSFLVIVGSMGRDLCGCSHDLFVFTAWLVRFINIYHPMSRPAARRWCDGKEVRISMKRVERDELIGRLVGE
jgi:hypothetical protein